MAEPKTHALQIPLMYAFREAFAARDARRDGMEYRDGERVLSERGRVRRRGANEDQLKRDLAIDLFQLANTINMEAEVNMTGLDHVRRSILNYGLIDLSRLSDNDRRINDLPARLKAAMLAHEPRFIPDSMDIRLSDQTDELEQTLRFDISAEMVCRPVDIPLEFVAEIEVASGRLRFSDLGGGL
jgi:type VI secretion system protein ImpF